MAATLDMTKFEFHGKLLQSINEMVYDDTLQGPEMTLFHTVWDNIVTRTDIGFIGEGGPIGVPATGCNPTPQPWSIGTRLLKWEPKDWEVLLMQCYTDLQASALIYSLNTGKDIPDFTDTDYMNVYLEVLGKAFMDFWYRLYWFNDTAAAEAPAGVITPGTDLRYMKIIDGLWKQIMTQTTVNPAQRAATITENTGATYVDQKLDKTNVIGYLSSLVYDAPLLLRQDANNFILVTQTVYDAYEQALTDACCLESARLALLNGMSALTFKGIPVIPVPIWDKLINLFENDGTKWNNPHRMLYTNKRVLGIGTDDYGKHGELRVWYEKKDRTVYTESLGRADAKLTNPAYFTVGI